MKFKHFAVLQTICLQNRLYIYFPKNNLMFKLTIKKEIEIASVTRYSAEKT